MITLHHLNNSRSQRILWLLEELELDYEIRVYQRDPETKLAPDSLKKIHPLGRAPVITDGDVTLAESGAIVEYLIHTYGADFQMEAGSKPWREVQYWSHFAEGTMMPPLVAKLVLSVVEEKAKPFFIRIIAKKIVDKLMQSYYQPVIDSNMALIEKHLSTHTWFAGDSLSAADFQMSFPLETTVSRGSANHIPNIKAFVDKIHARPAYQRALQKGGQYDYA